MMLYRGHGGNLSYMCDISRWVVTQCGLVDMYQNLTEHAAGMDNMIHENAGTCLPGFMVSHRTRLYLALTTMRTSDLTTVFTKVKYQHFACDYSVAVCLQFLKLKWWFSKVKIQYKIMLCPNICILMGGKSKV